MLHTYKHTMQQIKPLSKFVFKHSLHNNCANFSRTLSTSNKPELPPCDYKPEFTEAKFGKFEIERIKKLNLNPCLTPYYKDPLVITQGYKQYIWDNKGRRYLDMFGGIVTTSVGHCHPKLVDVVNKQTRKLWHVSSVYLNEEVHEYAMKLANRFPDPLNNIIFCNSGSEANDIGVLMARAYTGNFDILSFRNGYHGCSIATMPLCGVGSWKFSVPLNFGYTHVSTPDPYKGRVGGKFCRDSPIQTNKNCNCKSGDACKATDYYIEDLETILNSSVPKNIAGMFAESIQGVGGTVQYPKGYIKRAYDLIKARGGVFISDEVQTGFGRTGNNFWGFQAHGIVPDIVTMAKGIGNGFPMAAVITTQSIASSLNQAMFFNTFGGQPLSAVIGSKVLDIIEEEKLQQNSLEIGTLLMKKLAELRDGRYGDIIGDVRGQGLMVGMEMVVNNESMPSDQMMAIFEDCRDLGLVIGKGGPHGNVFRIKPPMCINSADVQFTVDVLKIAFNQHYERLRLRNK